MNKELQEVVSNVEKEFLPVSVFLYGSRARGDHREKSDCEMGVLYPRDKQIVHAELARINPYKHIVLYPFEYENFIQYKLDTPFQANIYLRDIILSGKTLAGKEVIEYLALPPISTLDLLQRIHFDLGMALAAVLSYRNRDFDTAAMEFTKSCLFGVRCLVILQKKSFPLSYEEIVREAQKLEFGEYKETLTHAYAVRNDAKLVEMHLYKNISLLNNVVKEEILAEYGKHGNVVLLA